MDRYGIPEQVWQSILSTIRQNTRISSIILFGSRAKGNFKDGSDIDLAIKGTELDTGDIVSISVHLDELELPWKIDLVNFSVIADKALIDHIDRRGIILD